MSSKDDMKKILNVALLWSAFVMHSAIADTETANGKNGVKLVPPDANTGAVAPSEQASTAREVKKADGQTLRCWQHGRLLYEDKGFKYNPAKQSNAVVIPRSDGESVVVFDQKDSICILSKK
jgi:hypothetical protein